MTLNSFTDPSPELTTTVRRGIFADVITALRAWTARQWWAATGFAAGFAVLIGLSTVLIPNAFFSREIDTLAWNYPVWALSSILAGLLAATYVTPPIAGAGTTTGEVRAGRMGIAGSVLAWFAVGCPVCNKIALLALGYTGALYGFGAAQPYLAALAVGLSAAALVWRLRGQVACSVRAARVSEGAV